MSLRLHLTAYLGLLLLLGLTIGVHVLDLKNGSLMISLGIAVLKGALIGMVFMGFRRAQGMVRLYAIAGLFWFFLLLGFVMNDLLTRG